MSPSPITKASVKEHKGNKKVNFSPLMELVWWKKNGIVTNLKLSGWWMSYPKLTNNGVVLFWEKRITKFGFV